MNVDREQQKEILQILFDEYPWTSNVSHQKIFQMFKAEPERTTGNLLYLQKHGLIENAITVHPGYNPSDYPSDDLPESMGVVGVLDTSVDEYGPAHLQWPALTEKGIDFLLGDDGLSSILNIQRVRIEESSLKLLSTTLIELAASSKENRQPLIEKLMDAPVEGLKEYVKDLVKEGLSSGELAKKAAAFIMKAAGVALV